MIEETSNQKLLRELLEEHRIKEGKNKDAIWDSIWKEYVRYTTSVQKVNAIPFHQWAKTSNYSLNHKL